MRQEEHIDIKTVLRSEPRIELIRKQLLSLLGIVGLEYQGNPVKVDGFRLKNPDNWKVPRIDDPEEIIKYLARMNPCPLKCEFCYLRGNPPEVIFNTPYRVTIEEIRTRMRYFFSPDPYMLYQTNLNYEEVFSSPFCLKILQEMRTKTDEIFSIVTAGRHLTGDFIEALKTLKPLTLNLSLNSADVQMRKKIMGDRKADVAIKALPLLRDAGLFFGCSLVAWCGLPLEDIEATIKYAAFYEPTSIGIGLGGFTRLNPPENLDSALKWWHEVIELVERMREEVDVPILTVPALFESNLRGTGWRDAEVLGVIKCSPAYYAGLKSGDLIEKVGGLPFLSRPHLMQILAHGEAEKIPLELHIMRKGQRKKITLSPEAGQYPYCAGGHFGVLTSGGLTMRDLESTFAIIRQYGAKSPLILSTALMRPSVAQALEELDFESRLGVTIDVAVVESKFFGGNIMVGGLMTVADYSCAVRSHIERRGMKPDLVLIPTTALSGWERDLTGKVFLDIERELDVPVVVMHTEPINY